MDQFENYVRYRNDPWAFLTECVFTLDQVKKDEPRRRFPDKAYLKYFVKAWARYPLMSVPKSRRMTMSWTTIGLFLWDTIFFKGRKQAFVSKKEDDADELVKRAKFIFDNLDPLRLPRELLPKCHYKFNKLEFPELMSDIQGFPQGADQLRQFTFSGIFGDECAFWENAEQFYSASFPTIDGGGRMTLVSSPAPGFFKKLCFDMMDVIGDFSTTERAPQYQTPMEGIRLWTNPKNKFMIFELHYAADPEKRHPSYKESIKNSMPLREYLREYELHWDTYSGQPVYPEFSKLHTYEDERKPSHGLPLLIGVDFGLTPAAVIGQYEDETLTIFHEITEINMGAERFGDKLVLFLRQNYPTWSNFKKDVVMYVDPSGMFRADTDERSCALILNEKGFMPNPGPIAFEDRRRSVTELLTKMTKSGPAFQIHRYNCPMSVKGFEGGYRYSDKAFDIEPNKIRPVKDAFSHPHDTIQYMCSGIKAINHKLKHQIPKPGYSLTGTTRGHKNGQIR